MSEISDTTLLWVGFQDGGMEWITTNSAPLVPQKRVASFGRSTSLFAHIQTGAWLWGCDGSINRHDADITNPTMTHFRKTLIMLLMTAMPIHRVHF